MSGIVGIGANVCDTLMNISAYPAEDTKLGAQSVTISGGGPCATGLAAASILGADCAYIGNLTEDNPGRFLKEDLEKYGVSTRLIRIKKGYTSFSSCIWLSRESASRTCVFYKGDVPPLVLDDEQKRAIEEASLLMIDGNEMDAAEDAVKIAAQNKTKVLYDAGGLYEGVERLLPYTDILIPSEEFALGHTGKKDAKAAAKALFERYSPEVVVITQGKNGGILYDGKEIKEYPAFEVDAVDTNGSGDVFHGAFAFSVNMGYNYYKACIFSSAVSAIKCTKMGARRAVPSFEETVEFLRERGINEF
ncbi:MAG: carbohydrate kinase family protein [Clostridiales bacterium]|nr:carbohydrate kinase family protein [Clostridiales bacterium]